MYIIYRCITGKSIWPQKQFDKLDSYLMHSYLTSWGVRRADCDSSWSGTGLRRSNPGGSSAAAVGAQPAAAAVEERIVVVGEQPAAVAAAGERTVAVEGQPAAAAAGAQPVVVEVEHKGQPAEEIIYSPSERLGVIVRQVNDE